MGPRDFKVGDWVKLNTTVRVVWRQGQDDINFVEVPPEMANTIFVVSVVCQDGNYHIEPHPIFSGLFRKYEGELYLQDTLVFDYYYPEELELVESVDD